MIGTAGERSRTRERLVLAFFVLICGFFVASPASAQQASGITGQVKDSSGGALPGVTVEASSPALIEKSRTVTTDGEGRYTIVDLRPGSYVVTFSLEGFSTVKRDGIELGTGFTATVNVSLSVGALRKRSPSAAHPRSSTRRACASRRRSIPASSTRLPSGNIGLQTLAYVTPGFAATQADVGGTRDTWSAQGNYTFYHGKTGTRASLRRLPQPVLHRRGVWRRLHHRSGQHSGTAARDERHGCRVGFRQHVAERHSEERQQHVLRRPRRLLLERRDAELEHPKSNLNDWAQGNPR